MQMTETEKIRAFHDEFYRDIVSKDESEDTYPKMPWDSFITLIESKGFKKGLEYMFWHSGECTAVIYYRDGLIIWATSFKNQIDWGSLYGELRLNDRRTDQYPSGPWSGTVLKGDLIFEVFTEKGIFGRIAELDQIGSFKKSWDHHHFLWFVDHREAKEKGYNHEKITKEKISKLPQECIDILEPERRI